MQRIVRDDIAYYTFDLLQHAGITHAISTRHGGISPKPFDTLNLSRMTGDDTANVATNIRRLHDALALDATATVDASQAQGDHVAIIDSRHRGTRIKDVDALLTNEPGIPLMLRYADCVPMFLFDPVHRAIGVVHAGWRGTVQKIATKAAQAMFDAYSTQPRDLIACIAPSIGPCCYQVGNDVIAQVRNAYDDIDRLLIPNNGGVHLDLWEANAVQFRTLGIDQIEIAQICTAHHTDDFYSWRAEKAHTGRFGAIIALTND